MRAAKGHGGVHTEALAGRRRKGWTSQPMMVSRAWPGDGAGSERLLAGSVSQQVSPQLSRTWMGAAVFHGDRRLQAWGGPEVHTRLPCTDRQLPQPHHTLAARGKVLTQLFALDWRCQCISLAWSRIWAHRKSKMEGFRSFLAASLN